ncbi:MAG: hypothetical protein ACJ78Q_16455 [Chloroflexia bacterium]
MASRITRKPDPSIKNNVLQARAAARHGNRAHASVVGASIAATVLVWVLFSQQDAQAIEAAREGVTGQTAVTTPAPVRTSLAPQAGGSEAQIALGITR